MKKIILFTTMILLNFACNNDDDEIISDTDNSIKLVKKITIYGMDDVDSQGNPIYTTDIYNFEYNSDNQLIKLFKENSNDFTLIDYSNGDPVKFNYYSQNVLNTSNFLELIYTNNQLSSTLNYSNNSVEDRTDYIYSNNKVANIFGCSSEIPCNENSSYRAYFSYNNNNISEKNEYIGNYHFSVTNSYDTNNHPFKNLNINLQIILKNNFFYNISENNPTQTNYYSQNSSTPYQSIIYTYIYDDENFPTKIKGMKGNEIWVEYTIEYN